MAVLVCGGAGYIGSVTVQLLRAAGETVVVLDNLSHGHRQALDPAIPFYQGDVGDADLVTQICRRHEVDACVHFAAFIFVGESVEQPLRYFRNNTGQSMALVDTLLGCGVKSLVFSSTAAVYGEPQAMPITEDHPQNPTSPYGWSKLMTERMLAAASVAHDFGYVALRYFNACGAIPGRGEDHDPENHLIPLVLRTALGQRDSISIFGSDYPTDDGTAVRDYIHVADLAQAHILALGYLRDGGNGVAVNLGNGTGYSVRDVIETAREVTGCAIPAVEAPRRAGDPSHLVADSRRARDLLGWDPRHPDLADIVASAWEWHRTHPQGYEG